VEQFLRSASLDIPDFDPREHLADLGAEIGGIRGTGRTNDTLW